MWNQVVVHGVVVLQWVLLLLLSLLLLLHPTQAVDYEMSYKHKQSLKEELEFVSKGEDRVKLHKLILNDIVKEPQPKRLQVLYEDTLHGPTPLIFPKLLTVQEKEQRLQNIEIKLQGLLVEEKQHEQNSVQEQQNHQVGDEPFQRENPLPPESLGPLNTAVGKLTTRVHELMQRQLTEHQTRLFPGKKKAAKRRSVKEPQMTDSIVTDTLEASNNNRQLMKTLFSQNIELFVLMNLEPEMGTRKDLKSASSEILGMIEHLRVQNAKLLDRLERYGDN